MPALAQSSPSTAPTSTGAKTKEAHKLQGSGCDRYGRQRLVLALIVRKWLEENFAGRWFIESGTLLGAYRNGNYIPHDDDFDMALLFSDRAQIPAELDRLCVWLSTCLPSPYKARVVHTYCQKIEVFDARSCLLDDFGNQNEAPNPYILPGERYGGADYHHVTVDIQAYAAREDDNNILEPLYNFKPWQESRADVFPTTDIVLEGESFKAPANPLGFLEAIYGSLAPDAVYDVVTSKYCLPAELERREAERRMMQIHPSADSNYNSSSE